VAIVDHTFLLAVSGAFGGIQINDAPPLILPVQESVGGSGEGAVQGFY
jgi:hypothetical protein